MVCFDTIFINKKMVRKLKAYILMVFVQIAYAAVNIIYKLAINDGMSMRVVTAYRLLFASLFTVPIALIYDRFFIALPFLSFTFSYHQSYNVLDNIAELLFPSGTIAQRLLPRCFSWDSCVDCLGMLSDLTFIYVNDADIYIYIIFHLFIFFRGSLFSNLYLVAMDLTSASFMLAMINLTPGITFIMALSCGYAHTYLLLRSSYYFKTKYSYNIIKMSIA